MKEVLWNLTRIRSKWIEKVISKSQNAILLRHPVWYVLIFSSSRSPLTVLLATKSMQVVDTDSKRILRFIWFWLLLAFLYPLFPLLPPLFPFLLVLPGTWAPSYTPTWGPSWPPSSGRRPRRRSARDCTPCCRYCPSTRWSTCMLAWRMGAKPSSKSYTALIPSSFASEARCRLDATTWSIEGFGYNYPAEPMMLSGSAIALLHVARSHVAVVQRLFSIAMHQFFILIIIKKN